MLRRFFVLLALSVLPAFASAQPYFVKDITTTPVPISSAPRFLASIGNTTWFAAATNGSTYTLWMSDGTSAGTRQVSQREISPIRSNVAVLGNKLIIVASDLEGVFKPFVTDGTEAGTIELPAPGGNYVRQFISTGAVVYFHAFTGSAGDEVWRTDGTPEGTRMAFDLVPGATGSSPIFLGTIGSTVIFSATTAAGRQLFRSDGTAEGTSSFGSGWGDAGTTVGNRIFFGQQSGSSWDLRITDGTTAGTSTLHSGYSGGPFFSFDVKGSSLYFIVPDAATVRDLWVSDGTAAGTQALKSVGAYLPVVAGNDVYYFAQTGQDLSLWKTNGTPSGNTLIKDDIQPFGAVAFNGQLFYGDRGDLWKVAGTTPLKVATLTASGNPGFDRFIAPTGNRLLFGAADASHGVELWGTDGTETGTRLVANIGIDRTDGSTFSSMQALGDGAIFVSVANGAGTIWISDGTDAGTIPLGNIPQFKPTVPVSTVVNGTYFVSTGDSLWRSDGAPSGTYRLFGLGDSTKDFIRLAPFGNRVIFEGVDDTGSNPWITDGTIAGTKQIPGSTSMANGAAIGNMFYFSGSDVTHGREPFRTDGESATLAADVNPAGGSFPSSFTELNGGIYFLANANQLWKLNGSTATKIGTTVSNATMLRAGSKLLIVGNELWSSDGTTLTDLANISEPPCATSDAFFVDAGVAYWISGGTLWRSDGSKSGTSIVKSVSERLCSRIIPWNHHAFFYGEVPFYLPELYITDGTERGTFPVATVSFSQSTHFTELVIAGSRVFFHAFDFIHRNELWAMPLPTGPRRRAR